MRRSDDPDVDCLRTLVAGLRLVLHARALGERAVAIGLDAGVVDEEVLAALVGRDEAKALLVAEPLDGTCCHVFLHGSSCCVCRGSYIATVCERLHCFRRTFSPGRTRRTVPRSAGAQPPADDSFQAFLMPPTADGAAKLTPWRHPARGSCSRSRPDSRSPTPR